MKRLPDALHRFLAQSAFGNKSASIHVGIIAIVSGLLTLSWFFRGLPVAYAEPGLFMYNDGQFVSMISHAWVDHISIGTAGLNVAKAAIPMFAFLALLQNVGFSPFQTEALFFYLILSLSGISMYYLSIVTFSRTQSRNSIALFASIFYLLNPYAMVFVWNRFLITMNTSYVMIPLVLALYIRGLEVRKYEYAISVALISAAFSAWLGILPVVVPFVILAYLAFHLRTNRTKSDLSYALKYSGLAVAVAFLCNLWVLNLLLVNLGSQWAGFSTPNYGQNSISGYPIIDVSRLNFYFDSNSVTWWFYTSTAGELLGMVTPLLVFGALTIRNTERKVGFFGLLAILGVLLGSVATSPLRGSIGFLLDRMPLSAVITNNMFGEKAIYVAALGYSILFAISLSVICSKAIRLRRPKNIKHRKVLSVALALSLIFLTCVAYVWPMWTGAVFTYPYVPSQQKLTYVNVPTYYADAATWLRSQTDDFRILALPLVQGGITYSWTPYGYSGATTDFVLLPKPVISEPGSTSDGIVNAIPQLMNSGMTKDLWKLLTLLNVKYVLVHEDINNTVRYFASNPSDIEQQLTLPLTPGISVQTVNNSTGSAATSSLENWQSVWGNAPAKISLGALPGGQSYVEFDANTLSNNGYFMFQYHSQNLIDLSNVTWIDLSLSSSLPGNLYITVEDVNGSQLIFDGRSSYFYTVSPQEVNTWTNITIPLHSPSFTTAVKPNLKQVHAIQIGLTDLPKNTPASLKLGGLLADGGARVPAQGLHYDRRFGQLVFYKVDTFQDRVYSASHLLTVRNTSEMIKALISSSSIQSGTTFITESAGSMIPTGTSNGTAATPRISFEEKDPSTWVVHVANASTPFILTFNEGYDTGWKAFYGDTNWLGSLYHLQVPDNYHFLANAYGNAWYIDRTGSFSVTLFFGPQTFLSFGTIISTLAISISLIIIIRKPIKMSVTRVIRLKCVK